MPRIPKVVGRRAPERDPDGIAGKRFKDLVNQRIPGRRWKAKSLTGRAIPPTTKDQQEAS